VALAYAHARGVIHRDIKPENILIDRGTGRALVTDFGIARDKRQQGLTVPGNVLGTVHYMSPEQAAGDFLDGRSDLYALGVVGYYILSGVFPFDSDSASAILVAHVTTDAPPLSSIAPFVPEMLAAVIDRSLAKNPNDRYPTGEEFAEALDESLAAAKSEQIAKGYRRRRDSIRKPGRPSLAARCAASGRRAATSRCRANDHVAHLDGVFGRASH
jgi:serine/threonine protein kinase